MQGIRKRKTKLKRSIAVGLFLSALLVIILFYPNIQHFKYSYQKGKPWQNETLYAPFNFPIQKTAQEIEEERSLLTSENIPYFSFQQSVGESQIAQAQKDKDISTKGIRLLHTLYSDPIVLNDSIIQSNQVIHILKDRISSKINTDDLLFIKEVEKFIDREKLGKKEKEALKGYIKPNLIYDNAQTLAFNNTENVSSYLGEVQANELIVSKGEVVTNQTYRILESLRNEYTSRVASTTSVGFVVIGQTLFVALCLFFLYLFLRNHREDIYEKPLYILFILLSIIIAVAMTRIIIGYGRFEIFLIPYTLFAVLIRTFMDSRTALFAYGSTMLICSFIVPQNYEFLIMQLTTGTIAILHLKHLERRSQLLVTAFIVFISYSILYTAIFITSEGQLEGMNSSVFLRFLLNAIFLTVAYPLLYLIEKTFGFISNVTLIELSNTNNTLLRELSQVAPGTFQHSMQMANLAEGAVLKIGGNPLLVRAGALYHDIGKMHNPLYFTENQHGVVSPHQGLTYEESARIIINHVSDGVKKAKKYNLPKQLIEFIVTHHGKGRTEYFYRSYMMQNNEKEIDSKHFSYPGPDPFTKEQAVLMLADTCEAATRSLEEKSEKNITQMVNELIDRIKEEGRLNYAPITFRDLEDIKSIFIAKLCNIYHSRIAYPDKVEKKN